METSSTIEFINSNGDEITEMNLSHNPFKIGEIIWLSVENRDPNVWTVKDHPEKKYKVDRIEHYMRITYAAKVSKALITVIVLSELK
jgi:hypothetical protein